ncbi:MAG TPA: MlaD family protein [Stellaceae bacterium]|nr:MlaD family protein [Stellaceae bacterium]
MTSIPPTEPEAPPLAVPEIRRRRHLSPIWAIPVVAMLIAAWLAYTTYRETGPTITITFETAAGLEAGKTRIKHSNVELGVVEAVDLTADLSHVTVTARMNKTAARHLTEGTRFWIVRPRLSLSNFSGIETLVSGAYVEMDPGEGAPARAFRGLEDPPVIRADTSGREFILRSPTLGSIGAGSAVFFRNIAVGEVLGYDFGGLDRDITIHAFVRAPYDKLVFEGTRFWNDSGVMLNAGGQGFKLEFESLQAVLGGGIAFETPDNAQIGEPAKEGTSFPLYADRESVQDASYSQHANFLVEFSGSVHGLAVGAPVEFKGVKVGRVVDIHLEFDAQGDVVRVPVTIELERQRVREVGGTPMPQGAKLTALLVSHGMRAQLRSESLLTGQLLVALDIFPNAPPAQLIETGKYPEIPTVPSDLENMANSLSSVLDHVAQLPLDEVVRDLHQTLQSYRGLAEAPEIKESLRSLSRALATAEAVMKDAGAGAGPLIASLRKAADSANGAFERADATLASVNKGYGGDSTVRRDLSDLVRQLQDTAKSVKLLADFLEQHPEALVRGKTAGATP